jgi:uncharacterized membrane protein
MRMNPHDDPSMQARVERLERQVEELQRQLAARPPTPSPDRAASGSSDPPPFVARANTHSISRRIPVLPHISFESEVWLNRLGIGMVLLGVALLFRYSIDQGWLTPAVRVGFGAVTGTVLFALGLRLDARRRFGEVLLGGGIATYYLVGWAAFHLYGLIGYLGAFAGMVAITVVAFSMALGRNAVSLGVLGAIGGLGTPLILGVSYGTPRGFAAYTTLILAWTAGVFLARGWRWLLWTAMPGGWLLLWVYARHLPPEAHLLPVDRWAVMLAALFAWVALGALPLARRVRAHRRDPHERHWRRREVLHWYALALLPAHALLLVAGAVRHPQTEVWGTWAIATAIGYAAAGWAVYRPDHRIARALLFTASVLVSLGSVAAFGGDSLLLALAGQALALHHVAGRGGGPSIRWMAHKVFIAAGAWMLWRLVDSGDTSPARVGADLAVVACALLVSFMLRPRRVVLAYRYFAHAALLGWVWRELAPLQGGQGIATIAWGAYGLGLLLLSLRRGWPLVEKTAVATLLLVVAKLFLVDLAALDALFRVLLFLGFGTVFLFLSYTLQAWWRADHPRAGEHPGRAR